MSELAKRILLVANRVCTQEERDALAYYASGLGYRATARALGISRDAARGRIERAMTKVAKAIKEEEEAA